MSAWLAQLRGRFIERGIRNSFDCNNLRGTDYLSYSTGFTALPFLRGKLDELIDDDEKDVDWASI